MTEKAASQSYDGLLFGRNSETGIVAVEFEPGRNGTAGAMTVFRRETDRVVSSRTPFEPFVVARRAALRDCPVPYAERDLSGTNPLNTLAVFPSWAEARKAAGWLSKTTGLSPGAPTAPYLFPNDPVHQHLMLSGRTCFKGMAFEDVRRMQVDIECVTTPGYEFCNAEREGDRIVAIALGDSAGRDEVLFADARTDEKTLLRRFVERVRECDPDVIEGHNIFNFDLSYLTERARRHGVPLALGRDGSEPTRRSSRFSVGERVLAYTRFDIYGRHIVDTFFLLHAYDVVHRSLSGHGLKEAAIHFGVAADNRAYIDGSDLTRVYRDDPERFLKYARDDIVETRALSRVLSRSVFIQAQMLPYAYQNVCVRGGAAKIDALMVREYLHAGRALPQPDVSRAFAGGYTDMFEQGVVKRVHHCDVRSLYPSLMLARKLAPRHDDAGLFLALLSRLKDVRMDARRRMSESRDEATRLHCDALQSAFKILINSFYGYLGFGQARFSDFKAAEQVAAQGRALLEAMVDWLRRHGARPVEIDTDGIYFVPPPDLSDADKQAFRAEFSAALPPGIEVEFDGEYPAMYSYKMKNYALLNEDGSMTIKGAALKSRGIEPFQRRFMETLIRMKLEDRADLIPALKQEYETAIREQQWPIRMLARTETLSDAPATYAQKQGKGKRNRSAVYELALKSGRDYRAGDQISYYVTGTKKSVTAYEYARLVSEWDPNRRDENVPYYLAKLEALHKKFRNIDTAKSRG